jgi:hypothetical protein
VLLACRLGCEVQAAWNRLTAAVAHRALGEGQKPESASGEARSRRELAVTLVTSFSERVDEAVRSTLHPSLRQLMQSLRLPARGTSRSFPTRAGRLYSDACSSSKHASTWHNSPVRLGGYWTNRCKNTVTSRFVPHGQSRNCQKV